MPKRRSTTKKPPENTKPVTSVAESGNGDAKEAPDARARKLPIIGLGASAGGLEALKSFFAEVLENSGMAYIVVVHMNPKQPSILPDLLQKVSRIPVSIAKDGRPLEPDHVYVVPPTKKSPCSKARSSCWISWIKGPPFQSICFYDHSLRIRDATPRPSSCREPERTAPWA